VPEGKPGGKDFGEGVSGTREVTSHWSRRRYQALMRTGGHRFKVPVARQDPAGAAVDSSGTDCDCVSQRTDRNIARQATAAGDATRREYCFRRTVHVDLTT